MELKKEKSCGCIIIKDNKVLLINEIHGNFWGFPKGHMENGENEIKTALREVKEEVGLDVKIDTDKRYVLNYIIDNKIDKTTVLYVAEPISDKIVMQESEIDNVKWCSFDEALDLLTFNDWKKVLREVINEL